MHYMAATHDDDAAMVFSEEHCFMGGPTQPKLTRSLLAPLPSHPDGVVAAYKFAQRNATVSRCFFLFRFCILSFCSGVLWL